MSQISGNVQMEKCPYSEVSDCDNKLGPYCFSKQLEADTNSRICLDPVKLEQQAALAQNRNEEGILVS
jgi:hypothetical protein